MLLNAAEWFNVALRGKAHTSTQGSVCETCITPNVSLRLQLCFVLPDCRAEFHPRLHI